VQSYRVNLGCEFLKSVYPAGLETKISSVDGAKFNGYLKWRQENIAKKRERGTIRRDVVRDELLVVRKMFLFCQEGASVHGEIHSGRSGAAQVLESIGKPDAF
jgi:hypothetical protein